VQSVLFADAKHRHDIRVVEASGSAGLAEESLKVSRIQEGLRRQDLERYVAAQRLLLGLVYDSHSATTDLTEDAEVAQTPGDSALPAATVGVEGARGVA
jgi:hypothetical protein